MIVSMVQVGSVHVGVFDRCVGVLVAVPYPGVYGAIVLMLVMRIVVTMPMGVAQ